MEPNKKRERRIYSATEKVSLLEKYKTSGSLKKEWCEENFQNVIVWLLFRSC